MKKTNQLVDKLKENRGITLIALVITIIVLLILAGVAVSSITGNDDIMDKAQNAKVATDNANEEEEIKMAAVTAMADNMEGLGVLTAEKLSTALNNKYPVVDEGDKIKVFAINEYTLDKNGSVTNDGETPKGEFSITSFSYTPNTVSIGGTSSEPAVVVTGTPYKGPKYTSSDESKATVNETTGVVTGVAAGEVTITVIYKNYKNVEVTQTTTVTVKPAFTTQNFSYTGSVQTCELPAGKYKLEVWGAQGGNAYYDVRERIGGYGGYSCGIIDLNSATKLYVYVGEKGKSTKVSSGTVYGGWNGGGYNSDGRYDYKKGTGGGATDISLQGTDNSSTWNENKHLYSRLIVAGGGGGGSGGGSGGPEDGGHGGGNQGLRSATNNEYCGCNGFGGNETSPGNRGYNRNGNNDSTIESGCWNTANDAGFGIGGNIIGSSNNMGGTGGGGWYGGGAAGGHNGAGGGGSGYVYTSSTASNYPSGCLLNSSYYLTNASTIAGNASIPNTSGTGTETGHSGNGYARISLAE